MMEEYVQKIEKFGSVFSLIHITSDSQLLNSLPFFFFFFTFGLSLCC